MTEMQAALGCMALEKLDDWLRKRRRNARFLTEAFKDMPILRLTVPPLHVEHAYYKYYAFLRPEALNPDWDRERILACLWRQGVPGLSGTCSEIYLEKAFANAGLGPPARLPNARTLGETSLMFLVHPTLEEKDMRIMVERTKKVLDLASK
jgi:dTDP-4-amino-4,6-dideoxygalactose transaminase